MVSTVKDESDKVIAYVEWRQVGQSGFDKLRGEYVWSNDIWLHDNQRLKWSVFRELIRDVFDKAIGAQSLYFRRKKYLGRISQLYSKEKIMELVERGMVKV